MGDMETQVGTNLHMEHHGDSKGTHEQTVNIGITPPVHRALACLEGQLCRLETAHQNQAAAA